MVEAKSSITIKQNKRKSYQITLGITLIIFIVGVCFFINNQQPKSALLWGLGVAAGFILQRSRFCFAASLRDPMLTGGTSLTKAVVIAIATATVGFSALQFSAIESGLALPGNIYTVGLSTIVGAILFGIGMVIAGGCASGTLMRVGEGFLLQLIVLIFFLIGSLWGAKDYSIWSTIFMSKKGIFLPDIIGWPLALVLQFGLLLAIFIIADWYENKKLNEYR